MKKKSFIRFYQNITFVIDRKRGKNLHEYEIRAFRMLGQNLLRKAFHGIKIAQ